MAALNDQFFNWLSLSEINLNEAQIKKLSNLFVNIHQSRMKR